MNTNMPAGHRHESAYCLPGANFWLHRDRWYRYQQLGQNRPMINRLPAGLQSPLSKDDRHQYLVDHAASLHHSSEKDHLDYIRESGQERHLMLQRSDQ